MAQPQPPWNNAEKVFLLSEIIKAHSNSPEHLFRVVTGILGPNQPNWEIVALPPGRPLGSCRVAFEELRRTVPPQPTHMMPAMLPQATSPMSAPVTLKRPYPFDPTAPYSGREIRPKPSSSSIGTFGQQSPLEQQPKKKRGRPTKAEAQARAEAQAIGGEAGPAPRPPSIETPIMRPPMPQPPEPLTIEPPRPDETRPAQVARMPIASMLTPTGQKSSNSQSSSSSGKRRRGRSTRSEPEDLPRAEGSTAIQPQEYESPYARMGAEVQDSPARAAVLRHRDEPDPRTPYTSSEDQPSTTAPTT